MLQDFLGCGTNAANDKIFASFKSFVSAAEKEQKLSSNQSKSKRKLYLIAGVVAIAVAILCCAKTLTDQNSVPGAFAGLSEEEKIALLNEQSAEGMVDVNVAANIVFPEGTTNPGEARFVNQSSNNLAQKFTLTLHGDDEILYESGIVEPGFWIDQITLSKQLDPGNYTADVTITTFDTETHEQKGSCVAEVKLTVI